MRLTLAKLDAALYRAERALAGALFLAMALVMFGSVVHRIFSRPEGRVAALVARASGLQLSSGAAHALNLALALVVVYAAVRSVEAPPARGRAFAVAVALTAALAGAVALILFAFPNGLVWGPSISLACMLWIGFLGASLATYDKRHLALEMGEKLWPARLAPLVQRLAKLAAVGMCGFLLVLSLISLDDHYAGWILNRLTGNLGPTPIPKWIVFLIFPYTFAVMSARFFGQALGRR